MFNKILIANRGEIALRIMRACREMGIKTVAVHSEADRECSHVLAADESICVGPAQAAESYLNIPNIISAAEISGADAIHPGYGFLAENTYFAEVCQSCGIKFIGPSKECIQKMGNKSEARHTAVKADVPVIPGSDGCVSPDDPKLFKIAKKIGYPIMVKASSGGGGKGMRIVYTQDDLKQAIVMAQAEAQAAFNNKDIYLERFIDEPRHIEFQILGDRKNNVVYLPERDCSIQRRHQKLIEESPSPAVSSSLRKKMGKYARRVAEKIGYITVGTVEFLLDKKENIYFMEMNTRIQVEHPVTEMLTGIDLVKEQIRLAAGEKIDYDSSDIKMKGHVIECRINAEDPANDFAPSPGKIDQLILPGGPGVRIDTHLFGGYTVPPYYDSLIAKLIVMDASRTGAINRMRGALRDFHVRGIKTTVPFLQRAMQHEAFIRGNFSTDFIQKYFA
ncbi:MAG: acetyl-CoA carboxylase biotin carboxylase subunit [bacterium]